MQNQTESSTSVLADISASLPDGITPLLDMYQFAKVIGYSYQGLRRIIREGRLPEGLLVRIGDELRFNPDKVQAVIRGELRILAASEANEFGRYHSRQVRADHEKRLVKRASKAARAAAEAQLSKAK
jgi:hypothetical protein